VAIDPDPRAAGLYLADCAQLGPPLNSHEFVDNLIDICHYRNCKYIFSGYDAELPILTNNIKIFHNNAIIPIVSDPEVIKLSNSKLDLIKFLKEKGFPFIGTATSTWEAAELDLYSPYIVKPDVGCRSQGIHKFENLSDTEPFSMSNGYIIQEYIEGEEYTCGTVSFDGDVKGVIAMTRELRAGDTYRARVDQNPIVIGFVRELMQEIKPFGPCNVQLRLKNNIPYVLEINARCSGTTAARTLAGFNEAEMVLNYLENLPIKYDIKEDLEIFRYWNEAVCSSSNLVGRELE
jgi:carbamoyl-phosphate synthase large subunit